MAYLKTLGPSGSRNTNAQYVLIEEDRFWNDAITTTTDMGQNDLNVSGSQYVTVNVGGEFGGGSNNIIEFYADYGVCYRTSASAPGSAYMGTGLSFDTNTGFNNVAVLTNTGQHAHGGADQSNNYEMIARNIIMSASDFGLSAATTYYVRCSGMTHNNAGTYQWGMDNATSQDALGSGVRLYYRQWKLVTQSE
jgi:hypothetical protein